MTNEISPLPCPFCGETTVNVHEGSSFRWRVAECGACSAQAPEVRVQTLGSGTPEQWDTQGHADAIKAWNTRAAPVEPTAPFDCKNHKAAECPTCIAAWRRVAENRT